MANVAFPKAIQILEKLLQGKTPKEIAHALDANYSQISETKNKFPLFLGLPHKYGKSHD